MSAPALRVIDKDNMDKQRALEAAIGQIERSHGKGAIMKLGGREAVEIETVSTGSLGLDIALGIGGPPFGLPLLTDQEASYPTGHVQLQPGDLLVIFTDGVVEAVNDAGGEYGEPRLISCIQNAPPEAANETLQRIMADVNSFVGYARQHDDITCLVLRVAA